ncbi:SLAP domain-containing protein [Guptibacillus hwajinpoensis]|uniref:SLAP domain-containing protein n=1 Tax=Guptibacillus hwajinpoensis TaxID=208199 RepID=A0A0J6CJZ5_9BACL|nr:SLAP domain-containing protein [Alkalihalobacillus macyae]KMM36536.1 hypothetical protein AB986_11220 [Alkalihalobacillus macyae]
MTLLFEEKWDRTIAPRDRQMFQTIYEQNPIEKGRLKFVPVRAAFNHQGCVLASVCILNGTEDWLLQDRLLYYKEKDDVVAKERFTHDLIIPSMTAVPWTFIYHPNSFIQPPSLHNWDISL